MSDLDRGVHDQKPYLDLLEAGQQEAADAILLDFREEVAGLLPAEARASWLVVFLARHCDS